MITNLEAQVICSWRTREVSIVAQAKPKDFSTRGIAGVNFIPRLKTRESQGRGPSTTQRLEEQNILAPEGYHEASPFPLPAYVI